MERGMSRGKKKLGRAVLLGAAAVGGFGIHEMTKKPKPDTAPTEDIYRDSDQPHRPVAHDRRHSHDSTAGFGNSESLTTPITADFEPNFEHMHFTPDDVLNLDRQYQPVAGYEETGWNPNGAYDEYLRGELGKDERGKHEYQDIASHLTITPDGDWISFESADEFGGIHLEYQFNPPSEENGSWSVTEYKSEGVESIYYPTAAPYQTEQDMKDQVLRLVKSEIWTEAAKYKLDEAQ